MKFSIELMYAKNIVIDNIEAVDELEAEQKAFELIKELEETNDLEDIVVSDNLEILNCYEEDY